MPRILRILNRFNLGGPVLNATLLSSQLPPSFKTLLIGGEREPHEASALHIAKDMGLEPRIIPHLKRAIHPVQDLRAYLEISRVIDDFRPDIVHTHASKAGAIGRLAAIRKNVPVIIHTFHGHVFHSYFSPFKTKCYIKLERYLARSTSHIIALSSKQKQELSDYGIARKNKISVVPLGFELAKFREDYQQKRDTFRKRLGITNDEVVIGIIGRLSMVKNHHLFLQAISQVTTESQKKIRAIIIGDGELKRDLMACCRRLHLPYSGRVKETSPHHRVLFTSWVNRIDEVYPGLDIVAMSSNNEGTPVTLIEAQAAGIPIVSTKVGGVEDIVLPGRTALLAKKNSPEDFTGKLLQLIEDEELRKTMGQEGWPHVKQKFHCTRLVNDTVELYEKLLLDT